MLTGIKNISKAIRTYISITKLDSSERNRFLMISLSLLLLLDYLLFCYISNRNPLMILPSLPLLEDKKTINIYIPDIDGKSIIKESRNISIPEDNEGYAKLLVNKIIKGSNIENTSISVPVELFIRKIWFYKNTCIIDIIPSMHNKETKIIPGSEKIFIESLEKTITENIPSVKKITVLERGIPGRSLWKWKNI